MQLGMYSSRHGCSGLGGTASDKRAAGCARVCVKDLAVAAIKQTMEKEAHQGEEDAFQQGAPGMAVPSAVLGVAKHDALAQNVVDEGV